MTTKKTTEIFAVAEGIVPLLTEKSYAVEEARRLPSDLARQLAIKGLFRLLTPSYLGGLEVSPQTFSKVLQILGRGDASVGWCTMIADTAALVGAYLDKSVAREIFADPEVILAGVFAPMGKAQDEGSYYRVSGCWHWASGSANANWLSGGAIIMADGKPRTLSNGRPEQRMMIFPSADVELIDTWHASGLKGTGSGDIAVREAIVPKQRSVSFLTDNPVAEGPLYAFPVFGLLALGIASVAIGNARAALDNIIDLTSHKTGLGSSKSMANRQLVQAEIAKAEAEWRSARTYLYESTSSNWETAKTTGNLDIQLRADLRLACINATRKSADVCRTAYDLGGGNSVFLSNELQRRFRDAHTMTQHIMIAPVMYEMVGRVMLGVETDTSSL